MRSRLKKFLPTAFFDIGHSSIKLGVVSADAASIDFHEVSCEGFAKGKVTTPAAFSAAISSLVKKSGLLNQEYRAVVNIPSLQTRTLRRVIEHRCNGTYRSSDFFALHDATLEALSSDLDEVIDVLYTGVTLDDKPVHPLSFGLTGREIKVQALLATHPKLLLADIISCMNAGGVEVAEFRANVFGLARALKALRPESENAVLIDVGHSTTTGVVAIGGSIEQTFCIAAGGHHMTRDMALGLQADYNQMESLKIAFGLSDTTSGEASEFQDYKSYLRPRVAEILALAAKNFAIYVKALDGGVLFCGNAAQVPGFSAFAGKFLALSAQPYVCQLDGLTAQSFIGCKINDRETLTNSAWLALFSHIKEHIAQYEAQRFEKDAKPLSRLRPLWTWLSELSR